MPAEPVAVGYLTQSATGAVWNPYTNANPLPVSPSSSGPAATPAACTTNSVATGGAANAIQVGPWQGILIVNGDTATDEGIGATEPLYLNLVGTATAIGNGTNVKLEPGQSWTWGPVSAGVTLSAIAATSGHAFTAIKW